MSLPKTAVVLVLSLAACRGGPDQLEFDEILRADGVRSVAVEDRFVLYSPYEPGRTQRYVTAANGVLDELELALGVEPGPAIVVGLVALPVVGGAPTFSGDEISFERAPERPSDGAVLGVAGRGEDRDVVVVYVSADQVTELSDGRTITGTFTFAGDLETLRHELTHVLAERAGLNGRQWIDEGLAHLFEHGRLEGDELVTNREASSLVAARDRYSETSLNLLLPWEETHADAVKGYVFRAGRPLSHALAVYVIESTTGTLSERIRHLAALDDADVLALEPAFRVWLAAGMPAPAAGK